MVCALQAAAKWFCLPQDVQVDVLPHAGHFNLFVCFRTEPTTDLLFIGANRSFPRGLQSVDFLLADFFQVLACGFIGPTSVDAILEGEFGYL